MWHLLIELDYANYFCTRQRGALKSFMIGRLPGAYLAAIFNGSHLPIWRTTATLEFLKFLTLKFAIFYNMAAVYKL